MILAIAAVITLVTIVVITGCLKAVGISIQLHEGHIKKEEKNKYL
jgi:hypothetical protein